jgi:predicted nucleic acid-binding protein
VFKLIRIRSLSQDDKKQDKALALLANKPVISIQVLNEIANVMRRKLGFDVSVIRVITEAQDTLVTKDYFDHKLEKELAPIRTDQTV